MLKKTITYTNLDGEKITEDFYFHLTKADLAKMELSEDNIQGRLMRMIEAKDGAAIIKEFERIIRMAYGQRSEDGKRFIRNQELADQFFSSEAYSELFMELMTDAKAGAEFIRALVPQGMIEHFDTKLAEQAMTPMAPVEDNRPAWEKENRDPTKAELMAMSPEEMRRAFVARLGKN
jgi:hypothetical protein